MLLLNTLTLLFFSLSSFVLAAPHDAGHDIILHNTCTATIFTTFSITYIPSTVTQITTIPYSCFTYLEATPQSNNDFCSTSFNPATCLRIPECILLMTISVPCHDPCCPTTKTVQTPGACASCQTGCGTFTSLVPGGGSGCPTGAVTLTTSG